MAIVSPNIGTWGISTTDFNTLKAIQTEWNTAFGKASNKQNRTAADVQAKADARKLYESELRRFVGQWLAKNAKIPDSERERMGLTVRKSTLTLTPDPSSAPMADIDFSQFFQHTIHFKDAVSPRKAKPKGVYGCEIWMKKDEEGADFTYVAICTCTPYLHKLNSELVGKWVYYRLRWVNTRGEQGPWSRNFRAMVVG